MIKIIESILPKSQARPVIKLRKFSGVTIHETGNYNKNANAKSHNTYMHVNGGKNNQVSYHYVVDDVEAYHLIPDDEVAWHAGDGGDGKGNNETIAIEICVNPECDKAKARENAMWLTAKILKDHGINQVIDGTIDKINGNLFQHNTFSSYRKNCPEIIRNNGLWSEFVAGVDKYLGENKTAVQASIDALYRVQVGAYTNKENADNMIKLLQEKGFKAIVTKY